MHALLLCAGLGTRLRPLTAQRPKPLVPVFNRPLASFAMARLAAAGVDAIVANTHHLAEQIEPALVPFAQRLNLAFETVHEPVILGTGGAIRNALPRLGREPFYVFNGDVFAAPDLVPARELHQRSGARITMIVREDPRAEQLGAIDVNDDARVVRILGEGASTAEPVRRCLFTGVYIVSPDVAPDLPESGCIVRHTLRRLLARGERVSAYVDAGPWFDLGTLETYVGVNLGLLDGSVAFPEVNPPFEARCLDPRAHVTEGVVLGEGIVVGARATLKGRGKIERAVVWEGATVTVPLANAVVLTDGTVVPMPVTAPVERIG